MLQKILNNIPNIENKKKESMCNLHQSNFHNLETMRNRTNQESFDDYMSSLYKTTLHSSQIPMPTNKKSDVEITAEDNEDGESNLSVLSAIASSEKPIPKKVPAVKGIDTGDVNVDNVDTKKYKLDWVSSAYIGSISVIGLFIAYKAIKRTM
jgi:hypothetical protein